MRPSTVHRRHFLCGKGLLSATALATLFAFVTIKPAFAQDSSTDVQKLDAEKRTFSEAELDTHEPRWPNPYLSFLPADANPDLDYWRAKLQLEGRRRAQRLGAARKSANTVEESEPATVWGLNDSRASAEAIVLQLPTREVDIAGVLASPTPSFYGSFPEDDGSITVANETELISGQRIRLEGYIGDGPYGSSGLNSGDYDVFAVRNVQAGQTITFDIDTDAADQERLDTKVALYDSGGGIIEANDDGEPGSPDSYLQVTVTVDGDYFVFVRGINSYWPSDPFDSSTGPKAGSEGAYTATIGIDTNDIDFFAFDLERGDVVGLNVEDQANKLALYGPAGELLIGSDLDGSALLPESSPLPGGGKASAAYVVYEGGRYAASVEHGEGTYTLHLRVFRPNLEYKPTRQTLFLDFDGAVIDAEALFGGNPAAELSPLADFLENMGLDPTPGGAAESAVIDAILGTVVEKLDDDIRAKGLNGDFVIDVLNSRDHEDPGNAPEVTRVIIGGTREQLGLTTVGIAQSVDVGNFATNETAVVLLDWLTTPGTAASLHEIELTAESSVIDLMGVAIGNIASHESGHVFANYHTGHPDARVDLMDGNPSLDDFFGLGPDKVFGSEDDVDVDFGKAPYNDDEGFLGEQDTRNAIAFGLFGTPSVVSVEQVTPDTRDLALGAAFPNPFANQTHLELHVRRPQDVRVDVFDMLSRRVRVLFEGTLSPGPPRIVTLDAGNLPAGVYLIHVRGDDVVASRGVVHVK